MTNRPWDRDREALREILKTLRLEKGELTQAQLSELLGKPQSYVSKYETGERKLDYVEIALICSILGLNMEAFGKLYDRKVASKT